MSLTKYESDIKHLSVPAETVYERCADLRNLESLKDKINSPEAAEVISTANVSEDKLQEVRKYINDIAFDCDSISLATPMGAIVLRVVEREPKCIKFASEGSPVPLYVWIQILPEGDTASKIKVTVGAEVNFFMKGMVAKPLQQAADGLANILTAAFQASAKA